MYNVVGQIWFHVNFDLQCNLLNLVPKLSGTVKESAALDALRKVY